MTKRCVTLLLSLALLLSLTAVPLALPDSHTWSIDSTGLTGTVTLNTRPDKPVVAVGSQAVYVDFTATLTPNKCEIPIPAFSFVLAPTEGMELAEDDGKREPGKFTYTANPDNLPVASGTDFDYHPTTQYLGAGGMSISTSARVLRITAKFPVGTTPTDYYLDVLQTDGPSTDQFTAGIKGGDQFERVVAAVPVTVVSGVSISGTVQDEAYASVTDALVTLYQDGEEVATMTSVGGEYSFDNLSSGSYTVRAEKTDATGTLRASAAAEVVGADLERNLTLRPSVRVSGTVTSWNDTDNTRVRLYPNTALDADIKADIKLPTSDIPDAVDAVMGEVTDGEVVGKVQKHHQPYSFDMVPVGDYKLAVYKPGHLVEIFPIKAQSDVTQDVSMYLLGDVNSDGKINGTDVNRLFRHANEQITLVGIQLRCGDVNQDNKVNGTDVNRLFRFVNEQIPAL